MSKGIDDLPHVCNLRANCCQEYWNALLSVPYPHTEWKSVVESEFAHHTKRLDNLHWAVPKQQEKQQQQQQQHSSHG